MKDGDRYIDPDGNRGVYNEEQNEAAKADLAVPKWKRVLRRLVRKLSTLSPRASSEGRETK